MFLWLGCFVRIRNEKQKISRYRELQNLSNQNNLPSQKWIFSKPISEKIIDESDKNVKNGKILPQRLKTIHCPSTPTKVKLKFATSLVTSLSWLETSRTLWIKTSVIYAVELMRRASLGLRQAAVALPRRQQQQLLPQDEWRRKRSVKIAQIYKYAYL